ncbi:MAG TPA: hypothetical protein DC042_11260 [Bacteroidales bacterium]|nr:hypothetical protein [Bacteroidales bacterium]
MKTISAYIHGAKTAWRSLRLTLFIYLSYLGIALLIAIPFFGLFRSATGNSELADGLMKGFDATIIREILVSKGQMFRVFIQGLFPWLIGFALLQVYLTGGIYSKIASPGGRSNVSGFHKSSIRFFWRFLKLTVYFLIIHILLGLILYLPYLIITGVHTNLTDKQVVVPFLILLTSHLVILNFIFTWSDLVKSAIYEQDSRKVFKGIFRCLKMALRNFFRLYLLGILLALAPAAAAAAYYLLRSGVTVDTTGHIMLFLLIQQMFIMLRVFFRIWRLSAVYRFYLSAINPIFGHGM